MESVENSKMKEILDLSELISSSLEMLKSTSKICAYVMVREQLHTFLFPQCPSKYYRKN